MAKEFKGLEATDTFGSKQQPAEANVISAKWIFTWRPDERGRVVKAKVRLVASGFSQGEGIDACETCAPRPSAACIRLLASIACEYDLDLCHFDAEQALYNLSFRKKFFSAYRFSPSPFSSPLVVIPKKNGGVRITVNYKNPNKISSLGNCPFRAWTKCWIHSGMVKYFRCSI